MSTLDTVADTTTLNSTTTHTLTPHPHLPTIPPHPPILLKSLVVEPALTTPTAWHLRGEAWVRNLAFHKLVTAHASASDGVTFPESLVFTAAYARAEGEGYEVWVFEGGEVEGGSKVYLRYETSGNVFYDNNGGVGINYALPIPVKQQPVGKPVATEDPVPEQVPRAVTELPALVKETPERVVEPVQREEEVPKSVMDVPAVLDAVVEKKEVLEAELAPKPVAAEDPVPPVVEMEPVSATEPEKAIAEDVPAIEVAKPDPVPTAAVSEPIAQPDVPKPAAVTTPKRKRVDDPEPESEPEFAAVPPALEPARDPPVVKAEPVSPAMRKPVEVNGNAARVGGERKVKEVRFERDGEEVEEKVVVAKKAERKSKAGKGGNNNNAWWSIITLLGAFITVAVAIRMLSGPPWHPSRDSPSVSEDGVEAGTGCPGRGVGGVGCGAGRRGRCGGGRVGGEGVGGVGVGGGVEEVVEEVMGFAL
ncbi:hypothetical protein HDU96_001860 [Phlyctochytrium bullatum]|nr:hypothetical protein HDU96_001860 [Phlyctochytrium bullatum]